MNPDKIVELIKLSNEGDEIVWDEPNGEVYVIKLKARYHPDWCPPKVKKKLNDLLRGN